MAHDPRFNAPGPSRRLPPDDLCARSQNQLHVSFPSTGNCIMDLAVKLTGTAENDDAEFLAEQLALVGEHLHMVRRRLGRPSLLQR